MRSGVTIVRAMNSESMIEMISASPTAIPSVLRASRTFWVMSIALRVVSSVVP